MFNFFLPGFGILFFICPGIIQPDTTALPVMQNRVVFYNVENLFYPANDSLKEDDDFTPDGTYHWTYRKYYQKINKIAQVIVSMSEAGKPALIGFCEIENRRVLEDLISKTLLKIFGYRIIHQESQDPRGIDVALLYDPAIFIPEKYISIRIFKRSEEELLTRGILKVTGMFYGKYKCHIFVNHWPSRRGGQKTSESRRMLVATHLREEVNRIFKDETDPNIIIMGDFNDEPVDKSLRSVLQAEEYPGSNNERGSLINLMFDHYKRGEGSHYRKNNFIESSVLDQFIVSKALIEGRNGMKLAHIRGEIYRKTFLINEKNGMPLRSYQGLKYIGGISDHLPVLIDLTFDHVDD